MTYLRSIFCNEEESKGQWGRTEKRMREKVGGMLTFRDFLLGESHKKYS